jgi:hypothetical protein
MMHLHSLCDINDVPADGGLKGQIKQWLSGSVATVYKAWDFFLSNYRSPFVCLYHFLPHNFTGSVLTIC